MSEIAVAGLDVDEAEAGVARQPRRRDEVVDQAIQLVVLEHAHAVREPPVEDRVRARGDRRRPIVDVRPRVAPRMRQLQADVEIAVGVGAESLAVRRRRARRAAPQSPAACRAFISSWCGLARPSWRTATASPPHISFAPLMPKLRQRRRVRSVGSPSAVPSHPSIGRMQNRLPTRDAVARRLARPSGDSAGAAIRSSKPSGMPLPLEVRAKGRRGLERGDARIRRLAHGVCRIVSYVRQPDVAVRDTQCASRERSRIAML